MKHLNLDPHLEKKKAEIMQQFREDERPMAPAPHQRTVAASAESGGETDSADPSEEALKARVVEALRGIYDPEIPVNIYDLGLIYRVDIDQKHFASIDMTLTSPGCPVAQTFPGMVEGAVRLVPGIAGAAVELVWDPPWTQTLISEAARLELGLI